MNALSLLMVGGLTIGAWTVLIVWLMAACFCCSLVWLTRPRKGPPGRRRFLYVRVEVAPADQQRVLLWQGLIEKAQRRAVPDVIPHTDPGSIVFRHVWVWAVNEDEAYDEGHKQFPFRTAGTVMNDYVVKA